MLRPSGPLVYITGDVLNSIEDLTEQFNRYCICVYIKDI